VALTGLLIAHHVGQAYGPTGGAWPIQEAARSAVLGPLFTIDRSFFMSLFFLISGYFVARSYDGKGGWEFVKGRLLRIGLPVLAWALLMIPLQLFVFGAPGGGAKAWPIDVGHLWFLEHLLLFSLAYALWRMLRGRRAPAPLAATRPPRTWAVVLFALVLALVSGLVRIAYPIDRWVYLLGFFRVAFADVPRDLSFFVLGLIAYRRQWLSTFTGHAGRAWLAAAAVLAALIAAYDLVLYDLFPIGEPAWGTVYVFWESLFCCAACIGLLVLFRDRVTMHGRLARALGKSQYAAYIIHVPVVLAFQYAALQVTLPPFAKFALVTLVSVPATFALANVLRRPLHL
jgi:peptidoglycan/LPS O-acetylase OafA/YrhL